MFAMGIIALGAMAVMIIAAALLMAGFAALAAFVVIYLTRKNGKE